TTFSICFVWGGRMKFCNFFDKRQKALRPFAIGGLVVVFSLMAFGQHQGHDKIAMPPPKASPSPAASPGPSPANPHANMPMPPASPSPSPAGQMPGSDMRNMNMGGLMVMSESGMGVRLGASESNVLNIGQMGSGTSRQPGSTPMYMMDKIAGKWLLMFHYNFVAM